MKIRILRIVKGLIFFLVLFLWVQALAGVFRSKIGVELSDGYDTGGRVFDAVVLGSSVTLYGVNPMELWKHNGISAYNMSSGFQSVASSYYLAKEAIEKLHPQLLIFDCSRITREEKAVSMERLHYITDCMPLFHKNRLAIIRDLGEEDSRTSLFFPLEAYHMRWTELTKGDFHSDNRELAFGAKLNMYWLDTGYFEDHEIDTEGALAETPMEYLQKTIDLCEATDTGLLLLMTPVIGPGDQLSQEEYDDRRNGAYALEAFAAERGIPCLNLVDQAQEIGLLSSEDTMDGEHLNVNGGSKFTDYLGDYLQENLLAGNHQGEGAYSFWEEAYAAYLPYLGRCTIPTAGRFTDYVKMLTGENAEDYIVFVTVHPQEKDCLADDDVDQALRQMGLSLSAASAAKQGYVALLQGGILEYETPVGDDAPDQDRYETTADGLRIRLFSRYAQEESQGGINLNDLEYTLPDAGIYFTVYQKSSQRVIDRAVLERSGEKISFRHYSI